jgi:HD-GYP domain-containing protein (c-di-GMP phosphodiesterase class II)
MDIDCYETPDAESLLMVGRERHSDQRQARRLLRTEAAGALVFVGAAVALAVLAPWTRPLSPLALVVTMAAYLAAARVTFPVGSAHTRPTQLVFVPMLFLLPTPLVPLVVAACLIADLWPQILRRDVSPTRVLARIGDSSYALGPALVLVLAHEENLSWDRWPVLVLAFAAQMLCDSSSGLARTWFAERIAPSEQVTMLWLYLTDACLSSIGLLVAASSVRRPGLILLVLPLLGLLWLFARERQQRIDSELALSTAYRGTALLLGDVLEADDHYTGAHSRDVVDLALAVADSLGLDPTRRRNVELAALLHDVGKLRVPKAIINKPGELDPAELAIMRRHTIDGEAMLTQVGGLLAAVGHYVRSTHECYDGSGYPDGLVGEAIPIESRIVCVCDAYSAMTSDRPYRRALSRPEAIAELRRCTGTQFDPGIVQTIERRTRSRETGRLGAMMTRRTARRVGSTHPSPTDRPPALTV